METQYVKVANYGTPRPAEVDGKSYLIVPVTMIVPGVLNGSQGPLLYTQETVAKSVEDWDGVDLTLDHPTSTVPRVVVGSLRNPEMRNGKLVGEAWIDVEADAEHKAGIMAALATGRLIEVSTGFKGTLRNEVGYFRGRRYTEVVETVNPDHLAILLKDVGACSINDGCGLGVANKSKCSCQKKGNKMNREKLIAEIIKNSNGVFTDAEQFEAFSDEQVIGMHKQQKALTEQAETLNKLTKSLEEVEGKLKAAEEKAVKNTKKAKEDDDKTGAVNIQNEIAEYMKTLDSAQYFELAPPEVKEVLASAKRTHDERKGELIAKLTEHIQDDKKRAALIANYEKKEIEELELFASAYEQPRSLSADNPFVGQSFVGNAAPRWSQDQLDKDRTEDVLLVEEMTWGDEE